MKITVLFVVLLTSLFSVHALATQGYEISGLRQSLNAANSLVELLSEYKTYKADFKQLTYSDQDQTPQISSGKLYMQRPGKFRWEVNKPNKQIIIANDKTLWIYDLDLKQVTKENIDIKSANNPAILLSGDVAELMKQYHVTKVHVDGKMWYQLKPRTSKSTFQLIRMHFSNKQLTLIWVKNNLGQTSIFEFSNIQLNIIINPALFNFKPPPGVDVLQ